MQISSSQWKDFLQSQSNVHLLQSAEWGELKSHFGWKTIRVINGGHGAQILFRQLPGGFSVAYIPKGPIGYSEALFLEIDQVCRENKSVFLKVEPNEWEPWKPGEFFQDSIWHVARPIQPRRTVMVNLDGTEEDILNRMKQKTRYNIRLAEKRDVKVRISSNVEEFHHLALQTAERDAFGIHTLDYYEKIYQLFHPSGQCELLTAYFNDQPLASLFVMVRGKYSFYMYGASSDLERNRMPTYLIQWEAMKWAKTKNCQWYDLWGIPDMDDEELEESFLTKHAHDGLWGVYRFKRGFGGEIWRSAGAWDRIYNSPMYWLYQQYTKLRGGGEG